MPALWAKLRSLLTGRRGFENDLRDEMRAHLEFEIEDSLASGLPPETARADAQRRFGNSTAVAERSREAWDFGWLADLARDLRYSVRSLSRRPAFAAIAVVSLAVALGANTAVFSFANAILLKTLPVAGAGRLVILRQKNEMFHMENCCFGYRFFQAMRKQPGDFEDVLAVSSRDISLADREETERVSAEFVSGNYFHMLGVRPAAGRLLDETDDAAEGGGPVCVISYKLWQERFAGDPAVIGRQVLLDRHPFQIVGVSQRGFSGASLREPGDIQIPTSMVEPFLEMKRDAFGFLFLIARLKPGVTMPQAAARLNATGPAIQSATGLRMGPHDDFLLYEGSQGISPRREELGKPVLVLLLLVGVLLLVACANLSALLLVRSVERTREAGVRAAIGASRSILFRQFLVEALLFAAAGGAIGWALSLDLVRVLLGLLSRDESLAQVVQPDVTVFAFAAAMTLVAALLFGWLPAWRASRADPLPAIHGAALGAPGRRQRLASNAVIAVQIALSLALVFCAGLFSRTLRNLRAIDLGFQADNIIVLPIDLAQTAYAQEASPFFAELLRRVRALPEARAASMTGLTVISGAMSSIGLSVPGYASSNGMRPTSYWTRVTSGYFRTMQTPLVAGRDFMDADTDGRKGEGAAIVNEQFARQFFAGNALGKPFAYGGGRKVRVVGIVRTSKFRYIREAPQPVMYLPIAPGAFSADLNLQVRVTGDLSTAIARLRGVVCDLGPHAPIGAVTTMAMEIDAALSRERLLAFLSTLLGAVAAALAAIGLYGVLSFAVTRRTREIGIRLSVGARRAEIVGLFLGESAWITAAGVALGIPLMLVCGKLAASLLYGLEGGDPLTVAAATVTLILIALAAAFVPAARAARTDPVRALRHE
jgi:predicted permease